MKKTWVGLVTSLILMTAEIVLAQTTWKGLKFGMSEADLRKDYTGSVEKLPADADGFILVDKNQKVDSWAAEANFLFDAHGKLSQIRLIMNDPFAAESDSKAIALALAVTDVIPKRLVERYGVPTSRTGECALTAEDLVLSKPGKIFTCDQLWRSDGQTIDMYWSVHNPNLKLLEITYKPLPADL
jgi:hypothetical protein